MKSELFTYTNIKLYIIILQYTTTVTLHCFVHNEAQTTQCGKKSMTVDEVTLLFGSDHIGQYWLTDPNKTILEKNARIF